MSGFEIFAATPPPYLVDGKRHFSKSRPRRNSDWTNIALAAARAGYSGILDLQLIRTEASEDWERMVEQIRVLFADECSGHLGLKYQVSQIPAMEAILLPAADNQSAKDTSKGKGSSAQSVAQIAPDFVIISPFSENRLLSLKAQSFREHVEKLRAANIRVLVEVFNLAEAQAAENASAYGVIAKGSEAEGQVGDLTAFVLLQQLTGAISLPVVAHGGIGLHTAAACYGAGAQGVVLTSQLLLAQEANLPFELTAKMEQLDGSETSLIRLGTKRLPQESKTTKAGETGADEDSAHYRVYAKPNNSTIETLSNLPVESFCDKLLEHGAFGAPLDWVFPLGQDVAFAPALALKFKSVAGILDAVKRSLVEHVNAARESLPLEPDSPLAKSHGTKFPIVQGAMTRVSDTADFAYKVAEEGALPFLALALMRKGEVEKLLTETRGKLQDRSWGVGLLGFVPNQLRQEQLEAIDQCKPAYALIAGGRPDQARFFEERGVKTYLHVPSPTLLASFIEMGSRRFIFEGNECGGHIGPRSSFVLWESMIEELLHNIGSRDDASKYHILFAGGIHDAKSASMVALMSAPLAARGVKIGILMGTAYLFTEEAVSSGAIVKQFQNSALQCNKTVLLETGPGHAIRCIKSPYKNSFDSRRLQLITEKKSRDEIREELELMNLGRLRIASKGLTRASQPTKEQILSEMASSPSPSPESGLIAVAPEKQWDDGMYMIGQVASLRQSVCTIKELHHNVSVTGCQIVQDLTTDKLIRSPLVPAQAREPVAIVGMACLFPKAKDLEKYWQNILDKVDAIEEVPIEQWDWRNFYDPDPLARDKIYSKWGGFLEPVEFDPTKYGIPPASLSSIDPMQVLLLEVTEAALKDAGYGERPFPRERTSVILANAGHGPITAFYSLRSMLGWKLADLDEATKKKIEDKLPEWTEDSFPGYLGNVTAGRVANRFDLGGVNYSIDAACASSLAALHTGMSDLRSGNSDVVLLSATDTHNQPGDYLSFSKTHAFSAQGRCRTFDASADGIVISEGMAMVVLKRLTDAERDGDRIYAVIRGIGGSSDGRDLSLTAPRPAGQKLALRRAYEDAGISPSTVGLIEAHGTGTVAGDKAEVEALRQLFEEHGAPKRSCAIGSVKTMIGHTKTAAGLASLIKVAKALHHKVLPPTLGVTNPNPACNFENSPFYISSEARPWLLGDGREAGVRRAGVSAFGFGGTNFHAVLEEYDGNRSNQERSQRTDDSELFVFQGRGRAELLKSLSYFAEQVKRLEPAVAVGIPHSADNRTSLEALAQNHYLKNAEGHSLSISARERAEELSEKTSAEAVLSIVATSVSDLQEKLGRAITLLGEEKSQIKDPRGIYYREILSSQDYSEGQRKKGQVAFLFPGQGSQYLNMLRDLALEFEEVKSIFEESNSVLSEKLEMKLTNYVFPLPSFTGEEEASKLEALTDTRVAQPAVAAADVAALSLMSAFAIKPDMVAGHSFGEYVALYAAGVVSFADLLLISATRGRLLAESSGGIAGAMAAVSCSKADIEKLLPEIPGVVVANINSPTQSVIAGDLDSVEKAINVLKNSNIPARRINVSQAFHTKYMEPAAIKLQHELERITYAHPCLPVYGNVTGKRYAETDFIAAVPLLLAAHTTSPVDFVGEIRQMFSDGARVFIETGPSGVLAQLVSTILGDNEDCLVLSLDRPGRNGRLHLLHVLAQLSSFGVSVDLRRLFTNRTTSKQVQSTFGVGGVRSGKAPRPKYLVTSASMKLIGSNAAANRPSLGAKGESKAPALKPSISPPSIDHRTPQRDSMFNNGDDDNGKHSVQPNGGVAAADKLAGVLVGSDRRQLQGMAHDGEKGHQIASRLDDSDQNRASYSGEKLDSQTASERSPLHSLSPSKPAGQKMLELTRGRGTDQVMLQFQATMLQMTSNFLATQEKVMLAYLQGIASQSLMAANPVSNLSAQSANSSTTVNYALGGLAGEASEHQVRGNGKAPGMEHLRFEESANAVLGQARLIDHDGSGNNGSSHTLDSRLQGSDYEVRVIATADECDADFLVNSLLDIVSQRTGYPIEMLDPNLDLEADLGIDSIKRVEILNSFRRILPDTKREQLEAGIEELAGTKTLQGIIDWLRSDPNTNGTGRSEIALASLQSSESGGNGKVDAEASLEKTETAKVVAKIEKVGAGGTTKARDLQSLTGLTLEALEGHAEGQNRVTYASGRLTRAIVTKKLLPNQPEEVRVPSSVERKLIIVTADGLGIWELVCLKLEQSGFRPVVVHHKVSASQKQVIDPGKREYDLDLRETEELSQFISKLRALHGRVGGVVHLQALQKTAKEGKQANKTPGPPVDCIPVYALFSFLRLLQDDLSDADAGPARVIAVSGLGADFVPLSKRPVNGSANCVSAVQAGIAGVIKTARKEFDDAVFRVIDLDPSEVTKDRALKNKFADRLVFELFADSEHGEIAYHGEERFTLTTQAAEIPESKKSEYELKSDSVVFVTGGARGITGDIVLDLARRFKPSFVIVGRSVLPSQEEESWLQGLQGPKAVKSAVIEQMKAQGLVVSVPMVEAEYQRITKAREVRHYLKMLANSGAQFEYHSVDVRDEEALARVIEDTYAKYGKIDLALHGAGIIEDAYIKDKSLESFQRVFETKVLGAITLAKHLRLESLERLVFFSSVVGREGNAGQVDYVAANEVVNKLARTLNEKVKGRAVSIMWGPWKGGMAQPELESIFASYGWAMIDVPLGCESFRNEISRGEKSEPEVLIVAELSHDIELTPRGPKLHDSKVRKIASGQFEFNFEVGAAVDLYLLDHTFDGVPVMPMAVALELMAEAVTSVYPQFGISRVEDFDIPAGIVFDSAKKTFAIQVTEIQQFDKEVVLRAELLSGNIRRRTNFKAHFVLTRDDSVAPKPPTIPSEVPRILLVEEASKDVGNLVEVPSLDDIYEQWLFHGPRFQGIQSIRAIGTHGVLGTVLQSLPENNFAYTDGNAWEIDPIMLDSAMQLAGIWARKFLESTVLPTGFKKLTKVSRINDGLVTARVFMQPETSSSELICTLAIYNGGGELALLIEGLGGVGSKSLNRLSNSASLSSKK